MLKIIEGGNPTGGRIFDGSFYFGELSLIERFYKGFEIQANRICSQSSDLISLAHYPEVICRKFPETREIYNLAFELWKKNRSRR